MKLGYLVYRLVWESSDVLMDVAVRSTPALGQDVDRISWARRLPLPRFVIATGRASPLRAELLVVSGKSEVLNTDEKSATAKGRFE